MWGPPGWTADMGRREPEVASQEVLSPRFAAECRPFAAACGGRQNMHKPTHLSYLTKVTGGISLMIRPVHDSVTAPLNQRGGGRNDETWKNRGPGAQSTQGRIMARRTKGTAPLLRNKSRGAGQPARERSRNDETWKNRGPGAPGRLHHKSLSEEHLFQVGVIPTSGEAFVLHADL
jgi:hypothetical protein